MKNPRLYSIVVISCKSEITSIWGASEKASRRVIFESIIKCRIGYEEIRNKWRKRKGFILKS